MNPASWRAKLLSTGPAAFSSSALKPYAAQETDAHISLVRGFEHVLEPWFLGVRGLAIRPFGEFHKASVAAPEIVKRRKQ